jgi:RNA polymerase-interacting CarD/CdnL/TRCF family regulator
LSAIPFSGLALLFYFVKEMKGVQVNLKIGDPVMHWIYGFGKIVGLEEREISGNTIWYYAVKLRDLTVWVPADGKLEDRLRLPTPEEEFGKLFTILAGSGEPLPVDRHERRLNLEEQLKDGQAGSMCRVVRDLTALQQHKSLNENDQYILKRTQNALLGEWGYSFSIPTTQAAADLHRMLNPVNAGE